VLVPADNFSNIFLDGKNNYQIFQLFASTYSVLVFYSNIYLTRCNITQFLFIWKLLYMFWVVPPNIIRSTNNYIYSIWYLFVLLMMGGGTTQNMYSSLQIKINCITLHLVGYTLEYSYDARTHEL